MTWLAPTPDREPTPSVSALSGAPRIVVVHATVSPAADYAVRGGANEARIRAWLRRGGSLDPKARGGVRKASTHFVVLRDGTVIQAAPLDVSTWHAGASAWPGCTVGGSVNRRSIGIDMETVGLLTPTAAGLRDCYGGAYEGPPPAQIDGRIYEPYTPDQVDAVCSLAVDIVAALPGMGDPARWVGHADVSPGRKSDPYPHFPWRALRQAVTASARCECVDVDIDEDSDL